MEGTIGEIRMFAGNFAPRSWAFAPTSLYLLLKTPPSSLFLVPLMEETAKTTFALPDFQRSRAGDWYSVPGQAYQCYTGRIIRVQNKCNTSFTNMPATITL